MRDSKGRFFSIVKRIERIEERIKNLEDKSEERIVTVVKTKEKIYKEPWVVTYS